MEFLRDLTVRCVDVLEVSGAVVLLSGDPSGVVEASDERTRALELSALRQGEGPCLESCRSGVALPDVDLGGAEVAARWPRYTAQARAAGFAAVQALPLRHGAAGGERVVGALGLFHVEGRLGADRFAFAQTLADLAAAVILRQRSLERSDVQRGQLQAALTSRVVIEQAKGVLAERWQCSVDQAFMALREYARARRLRLAEVARQVVAREKGVAELRPR
ncbi:ANTAR domain-containing protein [Streptomyces sp. NPDC041068]|uniref:ANTAR domain-containing protein n=1 Tax=Streptomyces sp. NPDC041068 TaxID=3155130 RepID=UPI0033D5B2E4